MVTLDIATLVFVCGLLFTVQTIAVFLQYRVNEAFDGLGRWLLGTFLQAAGFLLLLTINSPTLGFRFLAIAGNPLILAGQICLYLGLARFLGLKAHPRIFAALYAAFLVPYLVFIVARGNVERAFLVFASSALLFAVLAATVLRGRRRPFFGSAVFLGSVFLAYSAIQGFLAATVLVLPPVSADAAYYTNAFRSLAFLVPLLGSTLWTFGFIIMVNQRLNAANRDEREKLRLIFNMSPDAKALVRLADGAIVDVNAGFLAMTGYDRDEVIGKPKGVADIWDSVDALRLFTSELREGGVVEDREFGFRRKDGSRFFGVVSGRILQIDGSPHVVGVVHDVTDRKLATEEVRRLLAEKDLLLKEVHHRIKNNMGTIHSMLSLQAATLQDTAASAALEDAKNRLLSMGRLYDTLYKTARFSDISMRTYLPPLIDEIIALFPDAGRVQVEKRIDDVVLDVRQAQPLGIIINELLTNAMKYAFVGREENRILVAVTEAEGLVSVTVQDNGVGCPSSVDFAGSTGFGLTLVGALAEQIDGAVRIEREGGTRVVLSFPR